METLTEALFSTLSQCFFILGPSSPFSSSSPMDAYKGESLLSRTPQASPSVFVDLPNPCPAPFHGENGILGSRHHFLPLACICHGKWAWLLLSAWLWSQLITSTSGCSAAPDPMCPNYFWAFAVLLHERDSQLLWGGCGFPLLWFLASPGDHRSALWIAVDGTSLWCWLVSDLHGACHIIGALSCQWGS